MIDNVFNWSPSDFYILGTFFGFFLGCVTWLFVTVCCKILEYVAERKKK